MNMRSKIQHIENYGEKQINTFFFFTQDHPDIHLPNLPWSPGTTEQRAERMHEGEPEKG